MGNVAECLWVTKGSSFTPGPWHAIWLELNTETFSGSLEIIDRLRRETELPLLLHMLSEEPKESLEIWHEHGIDAMILAWNPFLSPETLRAVRDSGCLCGLSLVAGARDWVTMIMPLWALLDLVVVEDQKDSNAVADTVRGLASMRKDGQRPLLGVKSSLATCDVGPLDLLIRPAPMK